MKLTWGKTCKEVTAVLHDYVEGSIDPGRRAALDRHFTRCKDCRACLRTYEKVVGLTRELSDEDIPDSVRERVHAALWERLGRGRP